MTLIAIVAAAFLTVLIVSAVLVLDQRQKRIAAEDELTFQRTRAEVLHGQVPFPYGEKLP